MFLAFSESQMLVMAAQRYEMPAAERSSSKLYRDFLVGLSNLGHLCKEQLTDIVAPDKQHFQGKRIESGVLYSLV